MASNSSSIVISFSIAILLLLILLLLLSYNSKNKRDNMEQFNDLTSVMQSMTPSSAFKDFSEIMTPFTTKEKKDGFTSVANFDPYAKNAIDTFTGIQPNDINVSTYTNLDGTTKGEKYTNINEGFETKMTEPTNCVQREKLTSQDLLPKDAQNQVWSKMNPSSQADIEDQNFLTAGYHIGVNTVGQSLRNANLQLRSEIPNPQVAVSPWLISTIEPDIRANTLEIGSAPSY
jgi:hypothetical protein